jgi:hypothetical protein
MTIEAYLFRLHATRFLLIAQCLYAGDRRGLHLLKQWKSIRTCVDPDLHRREWYYSRGYYVCGACERLQGQVA